VARAAVLTVREIVATLTNGLAELVAEEELTFR
jgi:hypothetical protein